MTALRLAWREMRHRPGHAALFALATALGAGATGALGGYAAAVDRAVRAQAKELWAADLTVKGSAPLLDDLGAWARASWPGAAVARKVECFSMVRGPAGDDAAQVSLAAVTPNYPLYGAVTTADGRALGEALSPGRAVAAEKLLARLAVRPGDALRVGRLRLSLAGVVARRTDAPTGFFELAPALFVTPQDLAVSGLVLPGSRTFNTLYINLPPGADLDEALAALKARAAGETAEVASWRTDNPGVSRFLHVTLRFLNALALLLLALGGVGVATATSAALAAARPGTAAMLALGAPRGFLVLPWIAWAALLAAAGLAGAAALGAGGARLLSVLFRDFFPAEAAFSWRAWGLAAASGIVSTAAFAAFPLLGLMETPPTAVFAHGEGPSRRGARWAALLPAAAAWALVARLHAPSARLAAAYVAGGAVLVGAVWAAAWAGRRALAACLARAPGVTLRLAGRGLSRPGSINTGVAASLALSIALGLGLFLVEGNLRRSLAQAAPESGPTAFFINLRPGDAPAVRAALGRPIDFFPLIRGRVVSVNGVPARALQDRSDRRGGGDRLTREFGFSFGDALPPTDRVLGGGSLWDERIRGPQVSVFDEYHDAFGIDVGDVVEVNVLGRRMTATVSSLRAIDQSLRQPFFYFYFRPGSLGDAPYTLMGGAPLAKPEIAAAERRLAAELPHVTVIDLSDVAALTGRVLNRLAKATAALGALGAAGGLLLLVAGLAVTLLDRTRESVLFRTLGATARRVWAVYGAEYLLIGAGAAAIGGAAGTAAAWALTSRLMELPFRVPWAAAGAILLSTVAGVTALSLLVTAGALRAASMEVLRDE